MDRRSPDADRVTTTQRVNIPVTERPSDRELLSPLAPTDLELQHDEDPIAKFRQPRGTHRRDDTPTSTTETEYTHAHLHVR